MKNTMIKTAVIATLLFAGMSTYAGSFKTGSNTFEITPVKNLYLGKNIDKVWTINYSEQEKPVTISLEKIKDERRFVVRSEFFEVVYVSNNSGFGVRKIENAQREVSSKITNSVLNKEEMQIQRVISPEPVSDEYAMGLIASYLPDLINKGYDHLIY